MGEQTSAIIRIRNLQLIRNQDIHDTDSSSGVCADLIFCFRFPYKLSNVLFFLLFTTYSYKCIEFNPLDEFILSAIDVPWLLLRNTAEAH